MAQIDTLLIAPGKGDQPFAPFVHLWLSEVSRDSEGRELLSPKLMTDREIDESVDKLIRQLEKARKRAKRELSGAKGQSMKG